MEQPRRYPVIFNPHARSQKSGRALGFLTASPQRFTLHATTYAGEARELAAWLAAAGEPVVVAAGGDGTLNEVASGLAGSASVLGILPVGTMNVFARELGIAVGSLAKALRVIDDGVVREVDLFSANDAPFLQMAGVGFDAAVIEKTSTELKNRLGPWAYLVSAVKVLGEQPHQLEVICDDGRRESGVAVLAGNGALYGGPFRFFRHANNADAKLDVLVYKEAGYRLLLDSLRGLACGGIDLLDSIQAFQAESFTVQSAEPVPVEVDGEWAGRFEEVRFACGAQKLRVLAPAVPAGAAGGWKLRLPWPARRLEPQANDPDERI